MKTARKKPKLESLNPKSVVRIFTEIDLYINDFDYKTFKSSKDLEATLKGIDFSAIEKYFIITYLKKILSRKDSFLSKESKKQYVADNFDDPEHLNDWQMTVTSRASSILKTVDRWESRINRSYAIYLKTEQHELSFNRITYDFSYERLRLPISKDLTKIKNDFIKKVLDELSKAGLSKEISLKIIDNSFQTDFKANTTPAEFLNIEIDNSKEIHEAFYKIYLHYKQLRKQLIKDAKNNLATLTKEKTGKKSKLLNVISNGVTRLDFTDKAKNAVFNNTFSKVDIARMMYISFPQLRLNFSIYRSKNECTLETYLTHMTKNIRKQ